MTTHWIDGHEIGCPLHQRRFDVRSGQPTGAPATDAIPRFAVRIEGARASLSL